MFAKHDESVIPSAEGMDAMAANLRLCSPKDLSVMRSRVALQAALDKAEPGVFMVTQWSAGADHPWFRVEARWNGQAIDEDALDIADMVKPLAVSFGGFHDGMFMWSVEAPAAGWTPEEDHKEEPKEPGAGVRAGVGYSATPKATSVGHEEMGAASDNGEPMMPHPSVSKPEPQSAPVIRPDDKKA